MSFDLRDGIVRILKPNGETAGTGFVLTNDGLIVTCSHVVQSHESQKRGEAKPEKRKIVFHATDELRETRVEPEWWRSSQAEDVAILRVDGGLPVQVKPVPMGSSSGTSNHPFETFGFPKSNPKQGIWGDGHILRETKIQDVQVLQLSSKEVTPGFSGAPIVDRLRNRVVGMVTSIIPPDEYGRQTETAFITPIETLRDVCSVLKLSDICPYRNLEAFTEADATFFHGRARVIEMLVDNLQNEPRFLAVFGASGSGKSSVVQAGLIPRLRNGALLGSDRWDIIVTRPTDAFFKQHLEHLDQASTSVALVIDQFEELFVSYNETASVEMMMQLAHLLEHSPHFRLIIVMRDDFYSLLMRQETLAVWLKGRVVNVWPTLKREEVEAIVREPAELMGWQFEEGLVETIVDDVLATSAKGRKKDESSTILPLLEFTLTQLWERHQDGLLTHEDYRRIGGVTGGLRQWADNAYYTFAERLRPLVRRIFTDLVHLGDEEQHIPDSRRRRPLSTLIRSDAERTDISQIVQELVADRLLVTSQDQESKQEIVEIIHDALLWEWGLLKQWMEEDRRFLLWHQELERRMHAWVETNTADPAKRDPYKLFGGSDLTEAIEWLNTRASDLREDERAFIQASRERHEQEEQQKWRYTRRTFLVGLAGLGASAAIASRLLFQRNTPPSSLALPYSYRGHTGSVSSVAWSSDSQRLASASEDKTVRIWSTDNGQPLLIYTGHTGRVNSVAWSPDGQHLASGSDDQTVRIWDASSGRTLLTYTLSYSSVAWSPNGQYLASSGDKTVRIWNASNGQTLLIYTGHVSYVNSVAWSPDGQRLASASDDQTVQEWNFSIKSGNTILIYTGHTGIVSSVAWSPDGQRLTSASPDNNDRTMRIWDANSGRTLFTYIGHTEVELVEGVAWSPDGQRLASASVDNTVRIWDASSGRILHICTGHSNVVYNVVWSPDGQHLASASQDNTVRIWDANSGRALLTYTGHTQPVNSVAWSPDGQRLASASVDKTVRIWSTDNGQPLLIYTSHTGRVNSVAWSPDGQHLASASMDNTVHIWDASSRQTLFICTGHVSDVNSVAWSPDGQHLASASDDQTVRIWNASNGRTLLTYTSHTGRVYSVAWSPDGRHLASASEDKTVRVWLWLQN